MLLQFSGTQKQHNRNAKKVEEAIAQCHKHNTTVLSNVGHNHSSVYLWIWFTVNTLDIVE